ncbi:hypothetical protein K443DRAFT_209581 [Laccaria amethystina LaAM-08-1]|uniref:Uncharacterized protein n=1 Tax=Laccaria amethystina LaAM-08-1 TaxID=1095629 RepID=A0A0C9XLD6_9AGAR|nr:hypothetical protein K443DRAFT_209581 [Laccaria amethystina LaAM-08-1]
MEMHQEAVNGLERIKYYTADYSYPSWPETPGGIWHIFRQSQNFDRMGKEIYVDLCFNQRFISDISVIATESGAYLIMQVLRFLREYGNSLQHDFEKLNQRWTEFLFFAQPNPDPVPLKNELLRLVRSVNLIHPSLPPPSGLARLTWCLTAPGPYRYRNVPSPDNTTPPRLSGYLA